MARDLITRSFRSTFCQRYGHLTSKTAETATISFHLGRTMKHRERIAIPLSLQILVFTRTASAPSETVSKCSNLNRFAWHSANSKNAHDSPVVASCVQSSK